MTFRLATHTDLVALADLKPTLELHADRLEAQNVGVMDYVVGFLGGRLVTFGMIVYGDVSAGEVPYSPMMGDLFVDPNQRSMGIGRQLVLEIERRCLERGFDASYLSVEPEANPRAHKFYLGLGYEQLQDEPYEDGYDFTDSGGTRHHGIERCVDMRIDLPRR